jgi:hypothetical protein
VATYFDAINDGETTLANTLLASETVQIIVTDGSKLPTGGVGTSGFILKLEDTIGTVEYILCSSRSGNTVYIATDGRGYEGTDAIQWLSGSYIKNVFTKATKDEISENIGDLTYTEENYVVSDESVSQSINSLDIQLKNASNGVGNLIYTEQNYVVNGESLTESIDGLDIQLKDTDDKIGNLSSLNTTDKTSTVNAINEVDGALDSHLAESASDDVHGFLSDGKIIEEVGSNANGSFIKLSDGTLVCYRIANVNLTSTGVGGMLTFAYPATFITQPVGGFAGANSAGLVAANRQLQPKISVGCGITTPAWVVGTEDPSALNISATLGFFAIGKWK